MAYTEDGYEWLYRCPKPTFWRALTDNDRGSKFHIKSGNWLAADMFIDFQDVQVIMDGAVQNCKAPDNNSYGGDVSADEITVKYLYKTISIPSTTVIVSYTVNKSGKIKVDVLNLVLVRNCTIWKKGILQSYFRM